MSLILSGTATSRVIARVSWFSHADNDIDVFYVKSASTTSAHILCILSRRKKSITIDS